MVVVSASWRRTERKGERREAAPTDKRERRRAKRNKNREKLKIHPDAKRKKRIDKKKSGSRKKYAPHFPSFPFLQVKKNVIR